MAKEEKVEFEGEVIEALPNAMFRVQLDNDHVVLGHVWPARCAASGSASCPATASTFELSPTISIARGSSIGTGSRGRP